jgi:RNA polymerase sigma-70 factor, ECF subfamily
MLGSAKPTEDLTGWLAAGYDQSFRTACLLLGNRSDAEEAVQEAFLRAWRFRASLGTGSSLRPWLYRVVVNTCCSKLRTELPHRARREGDSGLEELAASSPTPEEHVGRSELCRDVVHALRELPQHLRAPVVLRYYAGMSEREIAIAIGRRPGTVKSRLHEARRILAAHPGLRALAVDDTGVTEEAFR